MKFYDRHELPAIHVPRRMGLFGYSRGIAVHTPCCERICVSFTVTPMRLRSIKEFKIVRHHDTVIEEGVSDFVHQVHHVKSVHGDHRLDAGYVASAMTLFFPESLGLGKELVDKAMWIPVLATVRKCCMTMLI